MKKLPSKKTTIIDRISFEKKARIVVTNDILSNSVYRDDPKVARSFDLIAKRDVKAVSKLSGEMHALTLNHIAHIEDKALQPTAARLLYNANRSIAAGIHLARNGYLTEFAANTRRTIETYAVILQIARSHSHLSSFHAGELKASKAITQSK